MACVGEGGAMVRFLLACWLGVLGIDAAQAAPVKYDFIGTVTHTNFGGSSTFPYAVGDRIPVTFTLQTAYPDTDPSAQRGEFYNPTGIYGIGPVLAVDIGGTGGFAIHQYLQVFNDYTDANGDTYDGLTFVVGEPRLWDQSQFVFRTSDLSVLDSDAIPTSIDPTDFEITRFQRLARVEKVGEGTLEAITDIPEPRTVALFGAALLLLAALRWRRNEAIPGRENARNLS
jgi:hypothetical protein